MMCEVDFCAVESCRVTSGDENRNNEQTMLKNRLDNIGKQKGI